MEHLQNFIANHYIAVGLFGLLAVFAALIVHALTGRKAILKWATVQYTLVIVMVLCTPIILWALTSKPI